MSRGAELRPLGPDGPRSGDARTAWSLLALSGIAFWFLVGFPFGHQNETYFWIPLVCAPDPRVAMFFPFHNTGSRPLGMWLAWLAFHVHGNGEVLTQAFNFLTTAYAWWTLSRSTSTPRTFGVVALINGGVLFSGYIYLFHLYGIFYGPMLAWLAWAARGAARPPSMRMVAGLAVAALVISQFHPYTLVFLLAFLAGAAMEFGLLRDRRAAIALVPVAVLSVVLIATASRHGMVSQMRLGLEGLYYSFSQTEVNRAVSVVALALTLATLAGTRWPSARWGLVAWGVTLAAAAALMATRQPVGIAWFAAALVKALVHRRWTLAWLLAVTPELCFAGASGSPTYAVYGYMLCAFVLALDWPAAEARLAVLRPAHALSLVAALVALAVVLRLGVQVPVASRLAHPMLAESERTHQLEAMLDRLLASPWRGHPVRFAYEDAGLVTAAHGVERAFRPPSTAYPVNTYLEFVRGPSSPGVRPVVFAFGGMTVAGARPLLSMHGRYAGDAIAYLAPDSLGASGGRSSP